MTEGRLSVAIAGEDKAHRIIAMTCLDLCLREAAGDVDWFDVENVREWKRFEYGADFFKLSSLSANDSLTIDGRRVRTTGHIGGRPQQVAASLFRRAWVLLAQYDPALVVILADTDGDIRKRDGALQVIEAIEKLPGRRPPLVVGLPHQDAEAWFITTWAPETDNDRERLAQARSELGFDPVRFASRLTASLNTARTDAKRVLRFLVDQEGISLSGPGAAPSHPPAEADLPVLATRTLSARPHTGDPETGLEDFLRSLMSIVRPLFSSHLPPAA